VLELDVQDVTSSITTINTDARTMVGRRQSLNI